MYNSIISIALFSLCILSVVLCLPPHKRLSDEEYDKLVEEEKNKTGDNRILEELGIEYNRYLQEVIETLEKDEQFRQKLQSANESDIKSAKIAEELDYVSHNVRSKLDELKRTELQRLRELVKEAANQGQKHDIRHLGHVDHENPNTFEVKDLKKLIHKVALDLEEADKKRKKMFKEYELQKQFERTQEMKNMTDEQRKKYLQEEEQQKKMEQEAKKRVHHPGSKQQLEEVWEEQDHMSKNDFNPKTFFVMHDIDGNGFLDEEEVKTLFLKELDKLYAQGMPHADLMERAEEMERMREHVFNEVDKNRDRLISWEEFYAMSLRPEFNEDPGWDPIDQQQEYTPEELQAFERQQAEMEQHLRHNQIPDYGYQGHNAQNKPVGHEYAAYNYPGQPAPAQQQYAYQGSNQAYHAPPPPPNQPYQVPNQGYQAAPPNQGYQPPPNPVYQGQNNQIYQDQHHANLPLNNQAYPSPNQAYHGSNQVNPAQPGQVYQAANPAYQGQNQVNQAQSGQGYQAPNPAYQGQNQVNSAQPNPAYQGQNQHVYQGQNNQPYQAQPQQPIQQQSSQGPSQVYQAQQAQPVANNELPHGVNAAPVQNNEIHSSKQAFEQHPNNLQSKEPVQKV